MGTVNYTEILHPWKASGAVLIQWTGMKLNDVGQPFVCPHYSDKTVQVKGTFGSGGNCAVEGSLDKETPTYATLNDPQGVPLDIGSAKIKTVLENVYLVRPNISAGDGATDLTVTMLIHTVR